MSRLIACLVCLILSFAAWPARADDNSRSSGGSRLALDLQYAYPIHQDGVSAGPGGALRFGKQLDLLLVSFTGELGAGYQTFGGAGAPKLYSGFVGGRIAVGKILEPGIYGHLGVGHASAAAASRTAPFFDAGLFLDLTVLPLVDIGVHGGYDVLTPGDGAPAFKYWVGGAHAALVF